jgi:hypothetical protein
MTFAEVVLFCGYLASALVFATFFMRGRARLRQVAIASNVAFITYGIVGGVIPVLTLHGSCCRSTFGACAKSARHTEQYLPP